MKEYIVAAALTAQSAMAISAAAQRDSAGDVSSSPPSNSLVAQMLRHPHGSVAEDESPHALRQASQFAVAPPQPRKFARHDLIQIIVHESTNSRSSQSVETEKEWELAGGINQWPAFTLPDLLQLQLRGSTGVPVKLDLEAGKEFEGEGEYERRDDFTGRLTAEVVEVLPNGNLVLEARTRIQTDEEISTMKVTGVCRTQDVTIVNTVFSNQLHDLAIEKMHTGELRNSTEKGIIAKVLDALFAF